MEKVITSAAKGSAFTYVATVENGCCRECTGWLGEWAVCGNTVKCWASKVKETLLALFFVIRCFDVKFYIG